MDAKVGDIGIYATHSDIMLFKVVAVNPQRYQSKFYIVKATDFVVEFFEYHFDSPISLVTYIYRKDEKS